MSSSYIVYSPIGSDPDSLTAAINIPNRETSSIRNLSNPVRGNRSFRLLNEIITQDRHGQRGGAFGEQRGEASSFG